MKALYYIIFIVIFLFVFFLFSIFIGIANIKPGVLILLLEAFTCFALAKLSAEQAIRFLSKKRMERDGRNKEGRT